MNKRREIGLAVLLSIAFLLQACSAQEVIMGDIAPAVGDQVEPMPISDEPVVSKHNEVEVLVTPTQGSSNNFGVEAPAEESYYQDVFFEDYGVNPFIETGDDRLSTFALDVDTGSYTIMRRYLRDGHLPPAEAIRVEEFVNFFDMDYPIPQQQVFGIYLEGGPTPFVQKSGNSILQIGIQGYDILDEERKDASLTFVIDVSGSMDREDRLETVKDSLAKLIDNLRPTDKVGIVVYGSRGEVILKPTLVSRQQTILSAIRGLSPNGSTNAEEGLQLGYQMASQSFLVGGINRVILCSDGVANVGNTGPDSILESIREYASQGIQLTTVGFGMGNYNDVLMEQLADDGDGFYAYVDTQQEAEKLFVHDLTGTLQAIALDAKVQVAFNPELVTRFRLIGYENRAIADEDFRNDEVDAGEIGAGHSVTALYEVEFVEAAKGEIATVSLRWQDPDTKEVMEFSHSITTSELTKSFGETSPSFKLAVMVAEYAEILRESVWGGQFTLNDLASHLNSQDWPQFQSEEVLEFENLVRQAARLREQ